MKLSSQGYPKRKRLPIRQMSVIEACLLYTSITVPEGQAETILEDETMRVKIRYVSRGYIRAVEVDLGRAQPSE